MPRFTVLLPTHNRADVIAFSIRSILAQTEGDFELYIVGDGCTDTTAQVVAAFSDPRIQWFDLPKAPHSGYANRNIALRQAHGEFIAYAQHDDLMLPDHLSRFHDAMCDGIDWAYSRPIWVTTDGIAVPFGTNLKVPTELAHFLTERNTIPSNCVVHRRDCLDRFGFWPEDVRHIADWTLWKTIIRAVGPERLAYLPVATTLHFSAVWKRSRYSTLPEVAHWLSTIEEMGWWPDELRCPVSESEQEQRIWFERLQCGGDRFVAEMRAAIEQVIDRQAWRSISHICDRLAALEAASARSETELRNARDGHRHEMAAAADTITSLGEQVANAQQDLHTSQGSVQSCRRDLRACRQELGAAQRELAAVQQELNTARLHLATVFASRSWRMTEPLRRVQTFLRGVS